MKKYLVLALSISILLLGAVSSYSEQDKKVQKGWENYQEQYEAEYTEDFEIVWNSVLRSLQDVNCQVITQNTRASDEGLFRGIIQSDFCVFAMGDTTFNVLRKYSLDMPFVRGGRWDNGRLQYRFVIQEKDEGGVTLVMKTEMSGMESGVAKKVLFWRSNGLLELDMMEKIKNNMGKSPLQE